MNLSVVIPCCNEEPNLRPLYEELAAVLDGLAGTSEIIFVDDGSTDGGYEVLRELARRDARVRLIRMRRNFGQTAAMAAGFAHASGDMVVTMDADRQNDPRDIPRMLDKIREGHDLVAGWRADRQDAWLSRRLPSRVANALISWTTDVKLHDYGCTLKAMQRDVAKGISLYGEMHRFIPAIASWMGVRIAELKVNHRPRVAGKSKYGISRTFRVMLDLITVKFLLSYGGRPIHFFGFPGLAATLIGGSVTAWLVFERMFLGVALGNRPLLLLSVLLLLVGVQFIGLGLLAELQVRTYHEAQDKPVFAIRETVGFPPA
jgi:glycosyltransferase involved in cell wall biosynthesis